MISPGFRIPIQRRYRLDRPWRCALHLVRWIACFGLITVCAGCAEHDEQGRVIVLAASSLTEPLQLIEAEFETLHPGIDLELIFAGSNTLAMQINAGAPADLFLSADYQQIQRIEGFAEPRVLVENQLVAIVPPGSGDAPIALTITDAIERASRMIVAQGDVPAGRYTRLILEELGLWEASKPKIVSYEHTVQGVLIKVAFGQGDLGFVYRTDALRAQDQVRMIEFPMSISSKTQTWIAIRHDADDAGDSGDADNARSPESLAADFIINSSQARAIFTRLGFDAREPSP